MNDYIDIDKFCEMVARKRSDLRYNQEDTANAIGISQSTLCRIEKGFAPGLREYVNVCRWLGVTMNEFSFG